MFLAFWYNFTSIVVWRRSFFSYNWLTWWRRRSELSQGSPFVENDHVFELGSWYSRFVISIVPTGQKRKLNVRHRNEQRICAVSWVAGCVCAAEWLTMRELCSISFGLDQLPWPATFNVFCNKTSSTVFSYFILEDVLAPIVSLFIYMYIILLRFYAVAVKCLRLWT